MQISTVLDHIDNGHMALPEFQRGYVWNGEQVRGLFDSLYKRHPVGTLLVWATQSEDAKYRGDGQLAPGVVKLLLDGQQRMTSLYGVLRGKPPAFFEGNKKSFTGLMFHLGTEQFEFYHHIKMQGDPLWINVSELMQEGYAGMAKYTGILAGQPELAPKLGEYVQRISRVIGIREKELHIEEVTGTDKTIDIVVDIFNKVNSGGTKLSKGDLALAKICSDWPQARDRMKTSIKTWNGTGYRFDLDWLLRNINTVITGEAKFKFLHEVKPAQVEDGLKRSIKGIDYILNLIGGRLGLDHDQVLFGKYAIPVMVRYYDQKKATLETDEAGKLLFWYAQAARHGRFSGNVESNMDKDLESIKDSTGALDKLIETVRLNHGGLMMEPGHFSGWSLGARFYPVLYMLTRVKEAKDWGTGLPIKSSLLGKNSSLEVHHIFPKAQLYKKGHKKPDVNAIANFCLQTKGTNLNISDDLPEIYFPEIEKRHPGVLASQWIPMDPSLWKMKNYQEFLSERRTLLANAANEFMLDLLNGNNALMQPSGTPMQAVAAKMPAPVVGGVENEDEDMELANIRQWVIAQGLPEGSYMYELVDPETGSPVAVFDMAWPNGLQEGLSEPVALLLNEGPEVLAAANSNKFRYFTNIDDFKHYILHEVLAGDGV